jgi:hypothetical protein
MTHASQDALTILRHTGHCEWNVLFGLGLAVYAYVAEIQKKNWDAILMGLLFSSAEFIWEVINALILHFTGYAPLWVTPAGTSFLILSGINIEIFLLFMLAGLCLVKTLQAFDGEPDKKILGIGYKYFIPLCFGLFCAFVEALLNRAGLLIWTYKYWNFPHLWSIVINYLTPFFLCTWGHFKVKRPRKIRLLGLFLVADAALWAVFAEMLGWI